jgi:outer membrane protein OmpA-like peptidoglycan-associated protein
MTFTGCQASVEVGAGTETPPPPPPPPPPDDDGDGILNPDDKCPDEKEDGQDPTPSDGCPNKDADGDGVEIPADKCPDQPETKNGFEDDDGCPDQKPLAQKVGDQVQINEEIRFQKGKSTIEEGSLKVIDAVAKVMKEDSSIELVDVGGHASKEGDEWYNRTLTGQRAKAVQAALVERGIEKERLMATGYGFYCPKKEGDSEAALAKNRRVEFKILYTGGKRTAEKLGCEESEKKGIKPTVPAKPAWSAPADAKTAEAAKPAGGAGIKSAK